MINAAAAKEALQDKREADRRQEKKEARERAAQIEEIKAQAHRDFEAELFQVEAAIKEAIAKGKSETHYYTRQDTAGEVLGPLLEAKLLELGYTARHRTDNRDGYRGGYDEQSWNAYTAHIIEISW